MSHDTLSQTERENLLRMAGVPDESIGALASMSTDVTVVEPDPIATIAHDLDEIAGSEPAPAGDTSSLDEVVASILAKAKGNKQTALDLVDAHVKAEFDRIKVSKKQAYERGLDEAGKKEHNSNAWKHTQRIGESLKAKVRAHFRDNGGFVQAKISRTKTTKTTEQAARLDAFMLANQDNPVVRDFLALLEANTQ